MQERCRRDCDHSSPAGCQATKREDDGSIAAAFGSDPTWLAPNGQHDCEPMYGVRSTMCGRGGGDHFSALSVSLG